MVRRIEAYVDGRPMPRSSSALTSDGSVYRAGGCVVCPFGSSSTASTRWPWTSRGSRRSASSASPASSSTASTYARRKPGKLIVLPDAPNSATSPDPAVPDSRSDTVWPRASAICEAMVRRQISSYSRNSSRPSSPATSPGVRKVSPAGRTASCASCAFFTLRVYCRGVSGTYSGPYSAVACCRAAVSAVSDSVVESVRM